MKKTGSRKSRGTVPLRIGTQSVIHGSYAMMDFLPSQSSKVTEQEMEDGPEFLLFNIEFIVWAVTQASQSARFVIRKHGNCFE
jgi:hypothetical protein